MQLIEVEAAHEARIARNRRAAKRTDGSRGIYDGDNRKMWKEQRGEDEGIGHGGLIGFLEPSHVSSPALAPNTSKYYRRDPKIA